MYFLIDQNLPAAEFLFGDCNAEHHELHFFSGRTPPAAQLARAEVLLIRSITQINAALLQQAPNLKFVGTATIGTDHVDTIALAERNIGFANAAGCNAIAVGEYVLSAALWVGEQQKIQWRGKRALIIGAGNTGTQAARCLRALGMAVEFIDPPRQRSGANLQFSEWQQLGEFDLISCHVPLFNEGEDRTLQLLDGERIAQLKPGALLINASRGPVVAQQPLLQRLQQQADIFVALDVWEAEPSVNEALVKLLAIATPHIAGHSIEGKIRGSFQLYLALHAHFGWQHADITETAVLPDLLQEIEHILEPSADATVNISQKELARLVHGVYPIHEDDQHFRAHGLTPEGFDRLRKEYRLRRELGARSVHCAGAVAVQLRALGFQTQESV